MPTQNSSPAVQVTVRDIARADHTLTDLPGTDVYTRLRSGGGIAHLRLLSDATVLSQSSGACATP